MQDKKQAKLIIILVAVIMLSIAGISYAYFTINITGNENAISVILKTGSLSLVYESGNEITAEKVIPGWSQTKTFTVTNNGAVKTNYSINWSEITNSFEGQDLVYSISGDNGIIINEEIVPKTATEIKGFVEIEAGKKDTYILTVKYKNTSSNQNADQGKTFSGKIIIGEEKEMSFLRVSESSIVETSKFLNSPITRQQIESIEFLDNKNIPSDAIGTWDVSEAGDKSIMAWYRTGDKTGKYKVYIGSDNIIMANPNSSNLFSEILNLNILKFNNNFDTSMVTNMSHMFYRTGFNSTVFTLDVSNFDTSQVTDMGLMFSSTGYKSNVFTLDVSNFNTSQVTDMAFMLSAIGYSNPTFTLDVSNFDTSKVTNMLGMFSSAGYKSNVFTLDVSNFNTSQVTSMRLMFFSTGYSNPTFTLDVSNFDTSKVTDMGIMFSSTGYSNLNFKLNIKNFTFSKVTQKESMFEGIRYGSTIYVRDDTAKRFVSNTTNLPFGLNVINCSITTCP